VDQHEERYLREKARVDQYCGAVADSAPSGRQTR
jgi:hypothetical protein